MKNRDRYNFSLLSNLGLALGLVFGSREIVPVPIFAESTGTVSGSALPQEVIIKGTEGPGRTQTQKPPLDIPVDPFETIRDSLKPDDTLLLAESPFTISWRRTHPDFLRNTRVIQPWRTTFSERSGIPFFPLRALSDALQRKVEPREAKGHQWSLTIADEEGKVFQRYEGSSDPPADLVWSGQNDRREWIRAGRPYSAVYQFVDPAGSPHTFVDKPLRFTGIVHQEETGLHVSMDSKVLFGPNKSATEIEKPGGEHLLRSASDLIKRHYFGLPLRIEVFASTQELGDIQSEKIREYLLKDLRLPASEVATEARPAPYTEARLEIILLNR